MDGSGCVLLAWFPDKMFLLLLFNEIKHCKQQTCLGMLSIILHPVWEGPKYLATPSETNEHSSKAEAELTLDY